MLIPTSFEHLSSQGYTVMPTIMTPVIASLLMLPRRRAPRRDKSLIQELHTDFCGRSSRTLIISAPRSGHLDSYLNAVPLFSELSRVGSVERGEKCTTKGRKIR